MSATGNETMTAEISTSPQSEGRNDNGNKKRGMVLPFLALSLTFDEIKYSVDMPQVCKF